MPIAFFSSGLTESQKNYSAGELECWALIAASRKFLKYLQAANKIHFISDHKAHPGMTETFALVKTQCYWKGMRSVVEDFCNECLICHRNKRKFSPKEELVSIEEPSEPNYIVPFDIATLPWSSSQHRYFMILVDLFSKFIELVPLKDQE